MIKPYPPIPGLIPSTPAIPAFYWNVEDNEQRWKHICKELLRLADYAAALGTNLNLDRDKIEDLEERFDQFQASGFFDYYAEQLEQWIRDNAAWVIETFVKMLWFGLSDSGYFVAYIPESWNDVVFNTGAVYTSDEYGRLILEFIVDNGEE